MLIIWEDAIVPSRRGDQRYSSPRNSLETLRQHQVEREIARQEMLERSRQAEQELWQGRPDNVEETVNELSELARTQEMEEIVRNRLRQQLDAMAVYDDIVDSSSNSYLPPLVEFFHRKQMRILDRKTIKKIRFSLKSHDTKMKRSDWESYYALLKLQDNFPLGDEAKEKLKGYRKRIKANIELHAKIGPEISTYITLTHSYGTVNFESKRESYKYILNRLKEKIRDDRSVKRAPKITKKEILSNLVIDMVGLVHVETGTFTDALQRHIIENCFEMKTPKPNIFPYIGLELECFAPIERRALAKKLKKFSSYIEIKDDGSIEIDDDLMDEQMCDCGDPDCEDTIRDSEWQSYEICVLVPESEMRTVVPELLGVLKNIDTRTNESCGMHVHLDMRNRNTETVFHNLSKYQDMLFSLVDSSRLNNTYCRKVDTNYFDEEREDHYNAISGKHAYNRHRTFEVRIHHGSVNEKEIMAWLELLTRLANYPSYMDKQQDLKGLAETISLTHETLEFYYKKIS